MRTWDIFCSVIDNYGDIGVSWRLARSLAREHGFQVRLWVDDLAAFQRLRPEIRLDCARQQCDGVMVHAWRSPFALKDSDPLWAEAHVESYAPIAPAEVVVEAFGCALPAAYVAAMAAQSQLKSQPPPVWINLEYLSAEPWVDAHHGLPSPHPRLPLTKYFFFPGYTDQTGGLLRERNLPAYRDRFLQHEADSYWAAQGLAMPVPGEWRVSLFAYENPALAELLDAWAAGSEPITLLVPEGRILPQLAGWLGVAYLRPGDNARRGALRVRVLPFCGQDDYDRLLWACDLNFVRGEDSCVRAQWAARPLMWQAYPQAETAHHDKLEALLARYVEQLPPAAAQAVADCWRRWNGLPGAPGMAACWAAWRAQRAVLERHAAAWQARLAQLPSLADALADFAMSRRDDQDKIS